MVPSPLTVVDFGYDAAMLEPLERRVTPGSYAVDVAIAYDRCAAMRIILGPGEPVSWHPAVSPDGGHVAGVDAGNLAVLDLPAYAAASVRDKERAYDVTLNPAQDSGLLLAFDGRPPIGAVSSSGWGDGAYPVYWGADAQGRPVQLVVDYLVLSKALESELVLPWADGPLPHPDLNEAGLALHTETEPRCCARPLGSSSTTPTAWSTA